MPLPAKRLAGSTASSACVIVVDITATIAAYPLVQVDMQARTASQAKVLDLFKHGGHSHSLVTGAAAAQRQNAAAAAAAVVAWHAASKPSDADWTPGGVWGLGTVVTLQQFEDMCGVCFEDKFITDRARSGGQGPTIFVE